MNFERAKTIILIAFVLLNAGLFALLFLEDRRYTLTGDRERNIMSVLSRNNIHLYTMPMRRFAPMRRLDITGFTYDADEMVELFFAGRDVNRTTGIPYYHFYTDYSEIIIAGGFVFYETWGTPWIETPEDFIAQHFPAFVEDISFPDPEGMRIVFLEKYRGAKIETNMIEFLKTDIGITQVEMRFGEIIGHGGDARQIFAPDEALLTFLQRWAPFAAEEPIFISTMEMVYYTQHISDTPGQVYHAVPHYRIFILGNDDHPILINAFTNLIVD